MTVQFTQDHRAVGVQYHAVVAPKNWKKSTLADRLQYVMDEMKWNEAELARQIGAAGQSTVQQWTKGRNQTMQSKFVWPLVDNHRWSARWLLDGDGEPRMPFVEAERRRLIETVSSQPLERLRAVVALLGQS